MSDGLSLAHRELTDMQQKFLAAILDGTSMNGAARAAGYAGNVGATMFYQPIMQQAIRLEIDAARGSAGIVGLKTLFRIARDKQCSPNAQVAAARTLVEIGGLVGPSAAKPTNDKPLEEMSTTELHEVVQRLEHELGSRAKPIVPDATAVEQQLIDM